jgi:L,D-transpeptidase YbiS
MHEATMEPRVVVRLASQRLMLTVGPEVLRVYPVSTARRGAGERVGSERTPRGEHLIRAKIGEGAPAGTVFVGRRPTGEIWSPDLAGQFLGRDWILTRILWLSGTEPGRNRLGHVDTMRRYIYIHGAPDSEPMGVPASHGCIRMSNPDVIDLFDRVAVGTRVFIEEGS